MTNARKRYSLNFQPSMMMGTPPLSSSSNSSIRRTISGANRDSGVILQKLGELSFNSSNSGILNANTSMSQSVIPTDIDPTTISNCKILLIGDSNVGKTATILSYCDELLTKLQWRKQNEKVMKLTNYSQPNIEQKKPGLTSNTSQQLGLIQRKRQVLLSTDKTANKKKRYSLSDFEELAKRRSLLFQKDGSSLLSPRQTPIETFQTLESDISSLTFNDISEKSEEDQGDDDDNEFVIHTRATIGVDIKTRLLNIDNRYFNCIMWDTAGQERFQNAIIPSLYKNCNGILLTYDICDFESFQHCFTHWLPEALKNMSSKDLNKARFYLIGNKLDLYQDRQVKHEDVLKYTAHAETEHGITIFGNFEVSCKWAQSIEPTFNRIILDLIEHYCYEDNHAMIETSPQKPILQSFQSPLSSLSPVPPAPPSPLLSLMNDLHHRSPQGSPAKSFTTYPLYLSSDDGESQDDDDLSVYSASSHRSEDGMLSQRKTQRQTIDLTKPTGTPEATNVSCCT
ncbi:hypothetical protein C6P45_003694 [Maudiozyma exigua]|uniref:GTP-binding protein YPT11 n=1 Tax=Maudiozyma exigua TaxID=34358 RepID=A0A9P7BD61_MAUEX|nr:hypothetical protein C6P45_003694 [Kazachstania exigua]